MDKKKLLKELYKLKNDDVKRFELNKSLFLRGNW